MIPQGVIDNEILNKFLSVQSNNIIIKYVPYLYFNFLEKYWQNVTINKFHCFMYEEYDKLCFLDADTFFLKNMDKLFLLQTPSIGYYYNNNKEFCISTGIFIIKPDLTFYSLLLNLCISLQFYDDENVFYYLSQQNNFLIFRNYLNDSFPNYKENIIQEQKRIKFWSQFTYDEINILTNSNGAKLLQEYLNE